MEKRSEYTRELEHGQYLAAQTFPFFLAIRGIDIERKSQLVQVLLLHNISSQSKETVKKDCVPRLNK